MQDFQKNMKEFIKNKHRVELQTDIFKLIARVANQHQNYINRLWSGQDNNMLGGSILYELYGNNGKMTQKALVKTLPVTRQAVTKALKQLKSKEYVTSQTISHDRRRQQIVLTEKGYLVLHQLEQPMFRFIEKFNKSIGSEDSQSLFNLLNKLNQFYRAETKKLKKHKVDDLVND